MDTFIYVLNLAVVCFTVGVSLWLMRNRIKALPSISRILLLSGSVSLVAIQAFGVPTALVWDAVMSYAQKQSELNGVYGTYIYAPSNLLQILCALLWAMLCAGFLYLCARSFRED